jgi:hypothetical protein
MCISIQKYVRNDFKGVLFLYVTVNVEPYGNEPFLLLFAINVSDLGWYHNGFHECSVAKLSQLLSDVLFHGGATLAVYIDCQQALPELHNFVIF